MSVSLLRFQLLVATLAVASSLEVVWTPERSASYCSSLPKIKISRPVQSDQSAIMGADDYTCMRLVGQNVVYSPVDFLEIMYGKLYTLGSQGCPNDRCDDSINLNLTMSDGFNFTFWWSAGTESSRFVISAPIGPITAAFNLKRATPSPTNKELFSGTCELLADAGFFAIEASVVINENDISIRALVTTYQSGVEAQFNKLGVKCVVPPTQFPNSEETWAYSFEDNLISVSDNKALHEQAKSQVGLSHLSTDTYAVDYEKGIFTHTSQLTLSSRPGDGLCDKHIHPAECRSPCEWVPLKGCKFLIVPSYDIDQPTEAVSDNFTVTASLPSVDVSCCTVATFSSVCFSPPCAPGELIWFNSSDSMSTVTIALPPCNISECSPTSVFVVSTFSTVTEGTTTEASTTTSYFTGKLQREFIDTPEPAPAPVPVPKEGGGTNVGIVVLLVILLLGVVGGMIGLGVWFKKQKDKNSTGEYDNEDELMDDKEQELIPNSHEGVI